MNKFNSLFLAIKRHSGDSDKMLLEGCFEQLSEETGIPLIRMEFYLDTLQNPGLIKYSIVTGTIRLTPFGRHLDRLFAD